MLTSIRKLDFRNWAFAAQIWGPSKIVLLQQAAFFLIATAIVISEEKRAFFPSRGPHARHYSMGRFLPNEESVNFPALKTANGQHLLIVRLISKRLADYARVI